jgi:SAM-dependent methyltransferase
MGLDRATWIRRLRRENEEQERALVSEYDERWGTIEPTHREWVERFLAALPPDGSVLDAACGTGKYFGMVLESGRTVLGVDHTSTYLDLALEKHPQARTERYDVQDLPFVAAFDGVMCVDAMEFVPPEDWPVVLEHLRRALRPGGSLYLTVELVPEEEVRTSNRAAREAGFPVVDGEAIWHDPDPYYHYYPPIERVHGWLAEAGFELGSDAEGPWEQGYAYHHFLARARDRGQPGNLRA